MEVEGVLLYSFFSECNAHLELIMGCTTQLGWNEIGLLYGRRLLVLTPGRLPTCVEDHADCDLRPYLSWEGQDVN